MVLWCLKFITKILPNIEGNTKLSNHIIVVTYKIIISFTWTKLNKNKAMLPLIAMSNTDITGIIDDNRYIVVMIIIAFI